MENIQHNDIRTKIAEFEASVIKMLKAIYLVSPALAVLICEALREGLRLSHLQTAKLVANNQIEVRHAEHTR